VKINKVTYYIYNKKTLVYVDQNISISASKEVFVSITCHTASINPLYVCSLISIIKDHVINESYFNINPLVYVTIKFL